VDAVQEGNAERARALVGKHAGRVLETAPALQAAYPGYFADEPRHRANQRPGSVGAR
jgi:hypothetical protein